MKSHVWRSILSMCCVVPMFGAACDQVGQAPDEAPASVSAALAVKPKPAAKPLRAHAATATGLAVGLHALATQPESAGDTGGNDTGGGDEDTNPVDCAQSGTTTAPCRTRDGQTCICTYNYMCGEEDGDCVCASVLVSVDCGSDHLVIQSPR